MLVVFEGIDGSGKTTLSNRVARVLAQRGVSVRHVRKGGRLASTTAENIRLVARDPRNAGLSPMAEMLLYAARDAQQLDEIMRPALASSEVVIADRFAYTALVMAEAGRGLPDELVRPVLDAVVRGVTPDLLILVDAEPQIARARRRVSKLLEPLSRPPSRKGLSGEGLMQRLRSGYREQAEIHADKWIVVDNTDADLDATVSALVEAIEAMRAGGGIAGARAAIEHLPRLEPRRVAPDLAAARAAFFDWIDRRARNEPALAAYFLGGLAGPDYDERRVALAELAPDIVADGLRDLGDPVSWELRRRLASVAPGAVARSLTEAAGQPDEAWALRAKLADVAPADVLASLRGITGVQAWALRDRLLAVATPAVVASLLGDNGLRAWSWRHAWLKSVGEEAVFGDAVLARAACLSITGLSSVQAWAWRERACVVAPAAALSSLLRVTDDRSWEWRREWLARAPRPVLRSLDGLDNDEAHELRRRALPLAPEAITSLRGLGSEPAYALREAALGRWAVAVAKSLAGPLSQTPEAQALLVRLLAMHPTLVGLWKHAGAAAQPAGEAR